MKNQLEEMNSLGKSWHKICAGLAENTARDSRRLRRSGLELTSHARGRSYTNKCGGYICGRKERKKRKRRKKKKKENKERKNNIINIIK